MVMRVIFNDDTEQALDDGIGQRVLYAVTTLAMTPVMEKLPIREIRGDTDQQLWPPEGPLIP